MKNPQIIEHFIEYLTSNKEKSEIVLKVEGAIGIPRSRIAITKFLRWIRLRVKFQKNKNLEFKKEETFHDLKFIFENFPALKDSFSFEDNVLKFKDDISNEEIEKIENFVLDNFKLKLRRTVDTVQVDAYVEEE